MTDPLPALDVGLEPAGEILGDNLQDALHGLDSRLAWARSIDDLQVAMTVTEDFMGSAVASGTIGKLGWAIGGLAGVPAPGTVTYFTLTSAPGIVRLGIDGSAAWMAINLGSQMYGTPVFVQETRCRLEKANTATDGAVVYFGLGNDLAAQAPTVGCYFSYGPSEPPDGTYTWSAVHSAPSAYTKVPIPMASADITKWHRFRVTSDGAVGSTVLRYYVDNMTVSVAEITTSVYPMPRYAPIIGIRRTAGTDLRGLLVDSYQLRWEAIRYVSPYEVEP